MSIDDLKKRFNGLYKLRENLCSKEKEWNEAFKARDWVIKQLKDLDILASNQNVPRVELTNRIKDLICVLEPEEDQNE